MVQFSLKLQDNKVSRWDKYYIDYSRIKKSIKEIRNSKELYDTDLSKGSDNQLVLMENSMTIESIIKEEVDKVEAFFCKESMAYLTELRMLLDDELQSYYGREAEADSDDEYTAPTTPLIRAPSIRERKLYGSQGRPRNTHPIRPLQSKKRRKDLDSVLRAVQDLYRRMHLLDSFAILNYTACVKATKKADKQLHLVPPLSPTMLQYVHSKTFAKRMELQDAICHCEKEIASVFCGRDIPQARCLLLPNKLDSRTNWEQFRLGYRLGIALVLSLWLVWDCGMESQRQHKDVTLFGQPAWRAYRGLSGLLLLHWAWGGSCYMWKRTRINYIYIFELDPRYQRSAREILDSAALDSCLFLMNALIYYKMQTNAIPLVFPPGILPLILLAWMVSRVLLPWSRMSKLWGTFGSMLLGILCKVDFFGTYVADVMTSSVKTLLDLSWTIGYFVSGDFLLSRHKWKARPVEDVWEEYRWYKEILVPLLCLLPLWIRFQQCLRRFLDTGTRFPNLLNALKYAIAQLVSAMTVFHPPQQTLDVYNSVWLFLYITSSMYSFLWDVLIDWGLGDIKHGFLCEHRMYSRKSFYYVAIALDLILRFNWVYSLVPPGFIPLVNFPTYITTIVLLLEFARRTMWGLFRLEHEHLYNSFNYRKVSFVPLHFSTEIKEKEELDPKQGLRILTEVLVMAVLVIIATVLSIILARVSNNYDDDLPQDHL